MEINNNGYLPIISCTKGLWLGHDVIAIAEKRGLKPSDVATFLSYNVISYAQLRLLTGVSEMTLRNLTKKSYNRKENAVISKLDEVNCFPDTNSGKLFIHMNEKCVEFIKEKVGI